MPKSHMNALTLGQYARSDTLLPWEDAEDYEKLRRAIFADLQPQGALEEEIASNIAENRWLRTRLRHNCDCNSPPRLRPDARGIWSQVLE